MKTLLLLLATAAMLAPLRAATPAEAFAAIPSAKAKLYSHINDQKDWRNPILIIRENEVLLNDSQKGIPTEKLLAELAKLPPEAWPYGRIVIVSDCPVGGPETGKVQESTWLRVLTILKSVGIEADPWPSA